MDPTRPAGRLMSLDEYLAFEEKSPVKHEYVSGEVYAMTGVTTRHNLITLNIATHLRDAARSHGCRVFATDVKLRAADRVYYPDVILACGKAAEVELIIEEPSLVVEVTSPSTRATDRREKLDSYRRIPSLRMYLIVEQRRRHVLVYARDANGDWLRDEVAGANDIPIPPLDTRIALDEIYEGIELPPLAVGEGEYWEDYGNEEFEEF
jgi:Uma2 family endonuclease